MDISKNLLFYIYVIDPLPLNSCLPSTLPSTSDCCIPLICADNCYILPYSFSSFPSAFFSFSSVPYYAIPPSVLSSSVLIFHVSSLLLLCSCLLYYSIVSSSKKARNVLFPSTTAIRRAYVYPSQKYHVL